MEKTVSTGTNTYVPASEDPVWTITDLNRYSFGPDPVAVLVPFFFPELELNTECGLELGPELEPDLELGSGLVRELELELEPILESTVDLGPELELEVAFDCCVNMPPDNPPNPDPVPGVNSFDPVVVVVS